VPEQIVCPYAEDHPAIEARLSTLEQEVAGLRAREGEQAKKWEAFLIAFGELRRRWRA
jgi:hypothetical protein